MIARGLPHQVAAQEHICLSASPCSTLIPKTRERGEKRNLFLLRYPLLWLTHIVGNHDPQWDTASFENRICKLQQHDRLLDRSGTVCLKRGQNEAQIFMQTATVARPDGAVVRPQNADVTRVTRWLKRRTNIAFSNFRCCRRCCCFDFFVCCGFFIFFFWRGD